MDSLDELAESLKRAKFGYVIIKAVFPGGFTSYRIENSDYRPKENEEVDSAINPYRQANKMLEDIFNVLK